MLFFAIVLQSPIPNDCTCYKNKDEDKAFRANEEIFNDSIWCFININANWDSFNEFIVKLLFERGAFTSTDTQNTNFNFNYVFNRIITIWSCKNLFFMVICKRTTILTAKISMKSLALNIVFL